MEKIRASRSASLRRARPLSSDASFAATRGILGLTVSRALQDRDILGFSNILLVGYIREIQYGQGRGASLRHRRIKPVSIRHFPDMPYSLGMYKEPKAPQ